MTVSNDGGTDAAPLVPWFDLHVSYLQRISVVEEALQVGRVFDRSVPQAVFQRPARARVVGGSSLGHQELRSLYSAFNLARASI